LKNFIKKIIPEDILALIFVYGNGSWLQQDNNTIYKILIFVSILLYLAYIAANHSIAYSNYFILFIIIIPILSTFFFNNSDKANLNNIINTSLLIALLGFIPISNLILIIDKYCKVIFFLIIASVIFSPIFLIFPDLLLNGRTSPGSLFFENEWYNFFVFTERLSQDFRSQSIFWEPGAWAYNQLFAFYWVVCVKRKYKYYPIFAVSLLLTLSANGLGIFGLLTLYLLFSSEINLGKKKIILYTWLVLVFLITVIAFLFLKEYLLDAWEIISEQTIGKLSSDSESNSNRSEATLKAWEITKKNPIWGIGRLDGDSAVYVTSCISEITYQLGIPYFIFYTFLFIQFFKKLNLILAIVITLLLFNGEAYSFFILNTLVIVIGTKMVYFNRKKFIEITNLIT
jgi:hypothetical protein